MPAVCATPGYHHHVVNEHARGRGARSRRRAGSTAARKSFFASERPRVPRALSTTTMTSRARFSSSSWKNTTALSRFNVDASCGSTNNDDIEASTRATDDDDDDDVVKNKYRAPQASAGAYGRGGSDNGPTSFESLLQQRDRQDLLLEWASEASPSTFTFPEHMRAPVPWTCRACGETWSTSLLHRLRRQDPGRCPHCSLKMRSAMTRSSERASGYAER